MTGKKSRMSSLFFETPEDMPRGMKALYEAKMAKERAKQAAAASPEPKPKSKGGKYHAEKCAIGDMKFDSKKEARRWAELYAMEQRGEFQAVRSEQLRFSAVRGVSGVGAGAVSESVQKHPVAGFQSAMGNV